jgi:hypothetical protein
VLTAPPVIGAVLLGLDRSGASTRAKERVRETLLRTPPPAIEP